MNALHAATYVRAKMASHVAWPGTSGGGGAGGGDGSGGAGGVAGGGTAAAPAAPTAARGHQHQPPMATLASQYATTSRVPPVFDPHAGAHGRRNQTRLRVLKVAHPDDAVVEIVVGNRVDFAEGFERHQLLAIVRQHVATAGRHFDEEALVPSRALRLALVQRAAAGGGALGGGRLEAATAAGSRRRRRRRARRRRAPAAAAAAGARRRRRSAAGSAAGSAAHTLGGGGAGGRLGGGDGGGGLGGGPRRRRQRRRRKGRRRARRVLVAPVVPAEKVAVAGNVVVHRKKHSFVECLMLMPRQSGSAAHAAQHDAGVSRSCATCVLIW